ncbi:MAG: Fe-S cluster assembly protein IscX [Deltaproteobacteria bacterium]|nr:Fe-S cluster assembly protein IscX [Deltaproteobacteria bacterium]
MKLKWANTEDLAFRLIDEYPAIDPMSLKLSDIQKRVANLPEFSDDVKKGKDPILEDIQKRWFEERSDMEDELGPMESAPRDDEDLDEDDYRDDTFAEDEVEISDADDEDEDEDEFGDGFQEEEADEK